MKNAPLWFALIFVGLLSEGALAQTAKDLVGSYTLVSAENVRPDGTKTPIFEATPRGYLVLDGTGRGAPVRNRGQKGWSGVGRNFLSF